MNANKLAGEPAAPHSSELANQSATRDWLRFIRDRRWSRAQKLHLIEQFGGAEKVYQQPVQALTEALPGRWQRATADIHESWVQKELEWLQHANHALIVYTDPQYPDLLRQICDPPVALFCVGNTALLKDPAVAIVGSRSPTPAGLKIATDIASDLAASGITIVSGLALGIDGAAHQGALAARGSTIAVMGCGLDQVYPLRHRPLFERIATEGCLISEFPLGVGVSRSTFPTRNRLVSGLALGTLVVEAATKSGTLITARLAMEQNRSVMAVPGSPLSRQYQGSHALLRDGAVLISTAQDVLQELNTPLLETLEKDRPPRSVETQTAGQDPLLRHIFHEPTSVDSIISASGLTAAEVSSMLLTLELQGLVSRASDGGYVKIVTD